MVPHAAIDRILKRQCLARGGMATPVGATTWAIEVPAGDAVLMFRDELVIEGDAIDIRCDAPLDMYTPAQRAVLGELHADIATALRRERIALGTFDEVLAFVAASYDAEVHAADDFAMIEPESEQPTTVRLLRVEGEPWLWLATPFEQADPAWLLRRSFELVQLRFELTEDGAVYLAAVLPIAMLTAQRLVELVDDLHAYHESLCAELAAGSVEDD